MTIGKRLGLLRHLVDPPVALRELAKLIEVSPAYPSLIESGERPDIGAGIAAGIAKTFGATIDYLVLGDGEPPSREQAQAAVAQARADLAAKEAEKKAAAAAEEGSSDPHAGVAE